MNLSLKDSIVTAISYIRKPWKRKLILLSRSLKNQYGIEIGGPSPRTFGLSNIFPVYLFAKTIDGVNFSNETLWEGKIVEGNTYQYYHSRIGHQYIAEASDLNHIETGRYDFLLSSHSLEHIANPLLALKEWNRVLKKGGHIILILPNKNYTFDRNRDYTTFQHLLEDFTVGTKEDDTTHFDEIVQKHDFNYDVINNKDILKQKLDNNFNLRIAHHHVFNLELVREILEFSNFSISYQQICPPFHLVTIATKKS